MAYVSTDFPSRCTGGSGRCPGDIPMTTTDMRAEIEEYLGSVPSFMEVIADPAMEHSWGMMRDLELGETELEAREKALIGIGAAAAMACPYCVHFHTEEAKLSEVTDDEIAEAVTLAGATRYFSTVLHGSQVDLGEFESETADIVEHIKDQQAAAAGDD